MNNPINDDGLYETIKAIHKKAGKSLTVPAIEATADRLVLLADYLNFDEETRSHIISHFKDVESQLTADLQNIQHQASEGKYKMDCMLASASYRFEELAKRLTSLENRINAIKDVDGSGSFEERILGMQSALMDGYLKGGADGDTAARCTSYTLWAYLGSDGNPTDKLGGME